jgi:hypothetical protein
LQAVVEKLRVHQEPVAKFVETRSLYDAIILISASVVLPLAPAA